MATAKEWGTHGAGRLRELFERVESFTIGAEEELLLVDPDGFDLVPAAADLVARLDDASTYRQELSAAQLEIVTPVCQTAGQVADALAHGRRRAMDCSGGAVRLAAAGVHPFTVPWAQVSPGPRFQRILREHRWGARIGGLTAGLHIHLGVPGADRALAVFNAMRGYMPEIAALAAASPHFAGRDTGFASIRPKLSDTLPHQGVAPIAESWEAYSTMLHWGRQTRAYADPAELWWECRLHLRLGTIEVRAPDAQA
jgi:carboxylate-amine ligase